MPPLPKKKHTKARKQWRNKGNALKVIQSFYCVECGAVTVPHVACPSCGYYRGRVVHSQAGNGNE